MRDSTARLFEQLEADPDIAIARRRLEEKIAELVDGATNQWDLLQHVLTEFEPAVASAVISACATAFGVVEPPVDRSDRPRASPGDINER